MLILGQVLSPLPFYSKSLSQHSFSFSFLFFLWLYLQHMEVPRLGVELELQLQAYATAMATLDLSHIYDLHHCLQQRWILNPLSEVRDQTRVLTDAMSGLTP